MASKNKFKIPTNEHPSMFRLSDTKLVHPEQKQSLTGREPTMMINFV
jgi:hypothetical protein